MQPAGPKAIPVTRIENFLHLHYLPIILHPFNQPVRQSEFTKKSKNLPLPNVLQAKTNIITAAAF